MAKSKNDDRPAPSWEIVRAVKIEGGFATCVCGNKIKLEPEGPIRGHWSFHFFKAKESSPGFRSFRKECFVLGVENTGSTGLKRIVLKAICLSKIAENVVSTL